MGRIEIVIHCAEGTSPMERHPQFVFWLCDLGELATPVPKPLEIVFKPTIMVDSVAAAVKMKEIFAYDDDHKNNYFVIYYLVHMIGKLVQKEMGSCGGLAITLRPMPPTNNTARQPEEDVLSSARFPMVTERQ